MLTVTFERAAYTQNGGNENALPLIFLVFAVIFGIDILLAISRNKGLKTAALGDKMEPADLNQYINFLRAKFTYFNMLNTEEQQIFAGRVHHIKCSKTFITVDMQVTEEMKMLLSAALAQLTFGFDEYSLPQLSVIHFTPEAFYSKIIGRNVKGLTFERGTMILSWKDMEQGFCVPDDKINLGLHEMAHALLLYKQGINTIAEYFDEWHVDALCELEKMRDGKGSGLLRDYAATNLSEFWAVSVECFFEAPVEFRRAIPNLYQKTSLLLNQDMAGRYEQYANRAAAQPVSPLVS